MALAREMPIRAMSKILREHDTRLWRVLNHYVEEARREADFSSVREVGVDETSSKRGHNYVTLFVDLEKPRTMFVTEGKDASTLIRFKEDFESHKGDVEAIEEICCDMSPAFIAGVEKNFPHAQITFDKFHVLKVLNEAAYTIKRHWTGILRWFKSNINNGTLEAFNSLVQAAKARARGYRTTKNLISMIYLITGKFNFNLPT